MAKINWTFQAQEELDEIWDFHRTTSVTYANFLIDTIIDSVKQLEKFPNSGRTVPEINITFVRELIVKNYRVIYSILPNEEVNIIAVRPSSIPLDRL